MVLEERLASIFEIGPQRTLAILQSDGRTVRPYMPPAGWSVVDFAVHPSGDISAILTTATEVRIVRLNSNGSIRSDQLFLDPSAPTDPLFNYAGGIKDDNALQPALMHDAARLAPLGESLAVVLRTGRNAIVAYQSVACICFSASSKRILKPSWIASEQRLKPRSVSLPPI